MEFYMHFRNKHKRFLNIFFEIRESFFGPYVFIEQNLTSPKFLNFLQFRNGPSLLLLCSG